MVNILNDFITTNECNRILIKKVEFINSEFIEESLNIVDSNQIKKIINIVGKCKVKKTYEVSYFSKKNISYNMIFFIDNKKSVELMLIGNEYIGISSFDGNQITYVIRDESELDYINKLFDNINT